MAHHRHRPLYRRHLIQSHLHHLLEQQEGCPKNCPRKRHSQWQEEFRQGQTKGKRQTVITTLQGGNMALEDDDVGYALTAPGQEE